MAVYVDLMKAPFLHMKMSHMVADSKDELLAMADKIGVQRKWIQDEDTPKEHFDISQSKRHLAIEAGAIVVGNLEMARMLRKKAAEMELRTAVGRLVEINYAIEAMEMAEPYYVDSDVHVLHAERQQLQERVVAAAVSLYATE